MAILQKAEVVFVELNIVGKQCPVGASHLGVPEAKISLVLHWDNPVDCLMIAHRADAGKRLGYSGRASSSAAMAFIRLNTLSRASRYPCS